MIDIDKEVEESKTTFTQVFVGLFFFLLGGLVPTFTGIKASDPGLLSLLIYGYLYVTGILFIDLLLKRGDRVSIRKVLRNFFMPFSYENNYSTSLKISDFRYPLFYYISYFIDYVLTPFIFTFVFVSVLSQ